MNPVEPPAPPREGEFRIELPEFAGPLDLLLHLIKKHDIDILDLPISFITERYLEYLRVMQELDLELAGEYLVMAATLAHIKSKMLLPQTASDGQQDEAEGGVEEDPRLELIRRLLEYQKYKAVADDLGSRAVAGRDVFPRGMDAVDAQGPAPLHEVPLFKLLDAFQTILARTKSRLAFEITAERITIHERITEITERLRERKSCQFEELFEAALTRYDVVVTFLALLEMTKLRVIRIYQSDYHSPIHVNYALLDASAPTIPPQGEGEAAAAAPEAATAAPDAAAAAPDAAPAASDAAPVAPDAAPVAVEEPAPQEEPAVAAEAAPVQSAEPALHEPEFQAAELPEAEFQTAELPEPELPEPTAAAESEPVDAPQPSEGAEPS